MTIFGNVGRILIGWKFLRGVDDVVESARGGLKMYFSHGSPSGIGIPISDRRLGSNFDKSKSDMWRTILVRHTIFVIMAIVYKIHC